MSILKNLSIILKILQKNCTGGERDNKQYQEALEKTGTKNLVFFPLHCYLHVLETLGLIKLVKNENAIILTEKGEKADYHAIYSLRSIVLLFLYSLWRIFVVAILLILFWPMYITIHKPPAAQKNA